MGMITRAKKRRMEEEERFADRISSLPDGVLGDIVSLLPTKAGARTQVLSSRWRHIWRSAPLNIDLHRDDPERRIPVNDVKRVLSAHPGPGRRFSIPKGSGYHHLNFIVDWDWHVPLDHWLQFPALKNLQELDLYSYLHWAMLPESVQRFSSTLRVATFTGFHAPDGTNSKALNLPVLEQLTLVSVTISEASLLAMVSRCSHLQSLLLLDCYGFLRLQIVSHSLGSIGMRWRGVKPLELHVVDAPCLQRLLFFEGEKIDISVISAPRLEILGNLFDNIPQLQFSTTVFQGSTVVSMTTVVHSVKVLALSDVNLSLDAVIDLLMCFPHLEKLYIKASSACEENTWYHKYRKLIATLDLRLKKIVLSNYQGSKSHINFAKFFVSNARVLVSMRLESGVGSITKFWIARQRRLLNIKKRASRGALFNFVSPEILTGSLNVLHAEQVHDLSTSDPFQRFHQ